MNEEATLRAWARAQAATVAGQPHRPGDTRGAADLTPSLRHALTGHVGTVHRVAATTLPDGTALLASGGADRAVRIWDPRSGASTRVLSGHSPSVWAVTFCTLADGTPALVSGGTDGMAHIWDPVSGDLRRTLPVGSDVKSVTPMNLADGTVLLATGSEDRVIRVWDPISGRRLAELRGHEGDVKTAFARLPDGTPLLASVSGDTTVRVWDPVSGDLQHILTGHTDQATTPALAVLADGSALLASGADDHTVRLWDPVAGEHLLTLTGHTEGFGTVAMTTLPDNTTLLASGSLDHTCRLWTVPDGQLWHVVEHPGQVYGTAFVRSADGYLGLATSGQDGIVRIYDLLTPPAVAPAPTPRIRVASPMAPSGGPEVPLVDGWSILGEPEARRLTGHTLQVVSVASLQLPSGRFLVASGSYDHTARVWDPETGECQQTLADDENVWTAALTLGPDGRPLLGTGGGSGRDEVLLWDPVSGERLNALAGAGDHVLDVAIADLPDGRRLLAAAGSDSTVHVWDPIAARHLQTLTGHSEPVYGLAFACLPDGQVLLASGSSDRTVRVWDAFTGEQLQVLSIHSGEIRSVTLTVLAGGGVLGASACMDATIQIWEPFSGTVHRTLRGHGSPVTSVCFANLPDGSLILGSSAGRIGSPDSHEIQLWNPLTGDELWTLPTPGANNLYSTELAFLPIDDEHLMIATSAGNDVLLNTVRLQPPPGWTRPAADELPEQRGPTRPAGTVRTASVGLASLANGDIHPPLSLLADLITATGPPVPAELELGPLPEHHGIRRLRALGWPAPARTGLAALLLHELGFDPRFQPPAVSPDELLAALRFALADGTTAHRLSPVPVAGLLAAAEQITDATLALLHILGPDAVAVDPLLPLRLRHLEPTLPTMDNRHLQLLANNTPDINPTSHTTASTTHPTPTTNGITRHGTLPNLLPHELALPTDLFTLRYTHHELLYHLHHTTTPPPLKPLTLILDTTPATYGTIETLLRTTAHLITTTLHTAGLDPTLITLDNPHHATVLRHPADLLAVWTSRTLNPPDLATALATARQQPPEIVVVLTQHRLPADLALVATPELRLLSTHAPGDRPRRVARSAYHVHLAPTANDGEIARAAARLVNPSLDGERTGSGRDQSRWAVGPAGNGPGSPGASWPAILGRSAAGSSLRPRRTKAPEPPGPDPLAGPL